MAFSGLGQFPRPLPLTPAVCENIQKVYIWQYRDEHAFLAVCQEEWRKMIEYLEIKIERVVFAQDVQALRTTIVVDGQKHTRVQMIRIEEFTSFFEQIWEFGGREVLAQLKAAECLAGGLAYGVPPHCEHGRNGICPICDA